jgi:hypothetical protein
MVILVTVQLDSAMKISDKKTILNKRFNLNFNTGYLNESNISFLYNTFSHFSLRMLHQKVVLLETTGQ